MNKKKQFAILGLGRFGASLAIALENMGYEVLCVDLDERVVERLSGTLSRVVSFDIRDAKALAQVGIDSFDYFQKSGVKSYGHYAVQGTTGSRNHC